MRAAHEGQVMACQLTELGVALYISGTLEERRDGHEVNAEAPCEICE